jgi:fibronectin-binding autotransporter adhesin
MTLNEASKIYVGADDNRYAVVRNTLFTKLWVFVSYTLPTITSGAIDFIKDGIGTLTLSGANSYTGKTIIRRGTLTTSAADKIPDASAIEVDSGATFQIGGSETVASLAGSGNVVLGANQLTLAGAGSTEFSGNLTSSTGTFQKTGSATQTLSGTSTFGGNVQLRGGAIVVSSGTHTQTKVANPRNFQLSLPLSSVSTLTISGGTLITTGLFMGENGGGTSTVNCNGGTLQVNGMAWETGVLSTLNINGGTFLTQGFDLGGGTGTTTSIVNLNSGVMTLTSALRWGLVGGATSTSTFSLNGGTLNCNSFVRSGGTNTFNFNGGTFVATVNVTLPTPFNYIVQSGGANFSTNSGVTLTTGGLSDGGGGGGVTKLGVGTLVLSGTLLYTGATSTLAGTTRRIVNNGGTSPGTVTATANFTNTTLSVSFNVVPSSGMTFKFFPTSTTQSYASITLTNGGGLTPSYDSLTSTLTLT